jgi:hypothetical protein
MSGSVDLKNRGPDAGRRASQRALPAFACYLPTGARTKEKSSLPVVLVLVG